MARADCARCLITFTGVTAFDMHLRNGGLVHVHPSEVTGLVRRDNGAWGEDRPFDEAARSRLNRSPQAA